MKQLPCIHQYVLGKRLKTIITMTNNLTDMISDDNFYLDQHDLDTLKLESQHLMSCKSSIQPLNSIVLRPISFSLIIAMFYICLYVFSLFKKS